MHVVIMVVVVVVVVAAVVAKVIVDAASNGGQECSMVNVQMVGKPCLQTPRHFLLHWLLKFAKVVSLHNL